MSEDVLNRLRDDLIVVPIFSAGRLGPTRVPVPPRAGGLSRPGLLFCEEITTIDRDFLYRGPLGPRLSRKTLQAVVRAVRRALGDVIPEP
jgi:mRNA-degrading endonuclease toxin of MazEF toxin-antitoxin module